MDTLLLKVETGKLAEHSKNVVFKMIENVNPESKDALTFDMHLLRTSSFQFASLTIPKHSVLQKQKKKAIRFLIFFKKTLISRNENVVFVQSPKGRYVF